MIIVYQLKHKEQYFNQIDRLLVFAKPPPLWYNPAFIPVNYNMPQENQYLSKLIKALEDIQASDIIVIDVREQTSVTDYMVICSGRASRHVKAIAEYILPIMKEVGLPPLHLSGLETGEWALVDFGDIVVHVMQPDSRTFYNLESLWQDSSTTDEKISYK